MSDDEIMSATGTLAAEDGGSTKYQPTIVAVDRALFGTPESNRITGGAGSGKTESLIDRVATLLSEGVAPSEILVLCATPVAAAAFSARLETPMKTEARLLSATTPRALALDLLSQSEARLWSGRPARLLAGFEVNFLLEDMKTSGVRPRRLREILKFFYRAWTELAEDNPDWLLTVEETQLHTLLRENLMLMQGMLEPELSKLAVAFLRSHADICAKRQRQHVLVDDFSCLSRASQLLAHLLASQSLTVAGDYYANIEVFDSYPYPAGLDELLIINPDTHCKNLTASYRSKAVTDAQNRLLNDESVDAEDRSASTTEPSGASEAGAFEVKAFETPDAEFEGVAALVAKLLTTQGYQPQDVGIVTLHPLWSKHVSTQLEKRSIPVDALFSGTRLTGDIRDFDRSTALRIYTALRLVASPADATAWRCWCGFGDYLANSTTFMNIKALAQTTPSQDGGLTHTLQLLDRQTEALLPGSEQVLSAYRAGLALVKTCQGLTGDELLGRLTGMLAKDAKTVVPPVLQQLFAGCEGMDAPAMVARAEQRLFFPQFSQDKGRVHLLEPKDLCSLSFKVLIVCGFVNGFLPCRDYFDGTKMTLDKQVKTHAFDVRKLYLMLGAAQNTVVFSHFERIDIERAERLKLKIARIRFEKGARVCLIAPSELLKLVDPKSQ
jgi:hypothetical protein